MGEQSIYAGIDFAALSDGESLDVESFGDQSEIGIVIEVYFGIIFLKKHFLPLPHHAEGGII